MQFANLSVYFYLCMAYFIVLVNCLHVTLLSVAVLWLNVMGLFRVWVGILLPSPCMIFRSVCVLCLSQLDLIKRAMNYAKLLI